LDNAVSANEIVQPDLEANERLRKCAERAQRTDRLAQEAEAEVDRLRKEMKRARKAYKQAREQAKATAKEAERARAELSGCLDGAFRDLAMALQEGKGIGSSNSISPSAKTASPLKPPASNQADGATTSEGPRVAAG
jgi:hypothetical protein